MYKPSSLLTAGAGCGGADAGEFGCGGDSYGDNCTDCESGGDVGEGDGDVDKRDGEG